MPSPSPCVPDVIKKCHPERCCNSPPSRRRGIVTPASTGAESSFVAWCAGTYAWHWVELPGPPDGVKKMVKKATGEAALPGTLLFRYHNQEMLPASSICISETC
jgi:hypothetical protein